VLLWIRRRWDGERAPGLRPDAVPAATTPREAGSVT
jgi:hypothetical protein